VFVARRAWRFDELLEKMLGLSVHEMSSGKPRAASRRRQTRNLIKVMDAYRLLP
jgi:hypothetical protein